ncbi:hypothetical protein VOLCADRAFT_88515 [Volvox carteri f. nagariensis]|uniref:Uncharacterized protein n=1 Tax=Volvox carteri f. nagariensis TaxID=3068 RepID=D8TP75_VOLCA|nr:uncharacterized protein VOLCADRAFT_88515 [Volvox carteri f. nagariensis]EFJ50713.1 hypothetical protein VOLCADRAFT_88515 [Volvox carteri f. nagariensis]|eukprot:XP_002948306.1 hypothetical protein VOLCADRAFT_88515 [Volvox carteri f. nagariensis]
MLQYYLRMEPHLFKTAVDTQLTKLREEKLRRQEKEEQLLASSDGTELALYRRMEEVREVEVRATLEDLMYVSILEKFLLLGVDMLPRMDGFVDPPSTNLKALTEGIHSKEALELVREHLLSVMGTAATAYSNAYVKMSKFQMAQAGGGVYAASVMFGYFLRRVDQRFRLEKALGTLPLSKEDAVARLERLFAAAGDVETSDNPDFADATTVDLDSPAPSSIGSSVDEDTTTSSAASTAGAYGSANRSSGGAASTSGRGPVGSRRGPGAEGGGGRGKSALRRYVESFDQATMVETARVVSVEGAALVERQTSALLGDIKKLTTQMQEVVGDNASSMQEAIERMAKAVELDMVETVTMAVATQRRSVLEAVAFGSFLRDVESWVQDEYALLTPIPPPQLPPAATV